MKKLVNATISRINVVEVLDIGQHVVAQGETLSAQGVGGDRRRWLIYRRNDITPFATVNIENLERWRAEGRVAFKDPA